MIISDQHKKIQVLIINGKYGKTLQSMGITRSEIRQRYSNRIQASVNVPVLIDPQFEDRIMT